MQQEPRATPLRTESADSGLDQAAKLWKRLASNSFTKNPHLRPSSTTATTSRDAHTSDAWTASLPSLSEKKASGTEISASATINGGTTSFMQSINKQVKTLKSRRTQSTSQIEVASPHQVHKSLQGRVLGGLKFGSSHRSKGNGAIPPETPAQVQNAKELEREWAELDSLMEEMAHLWRFVKSLDDNDEEQDSDDAEDRARGLDLLREESAEDAQMLDPFHDRNQILPSHAALSAATATTTITATAREFDRLTLDMAGMGEDLPQYYEATPQYNLLEKSGAAATTTNSHQDRNNSLTRRTNRGGALAPAAGLDDEKTRFDLHNVMSAIERLSQVAPRMDNQRVQLSPSQKRQMARASVSRTIERLSTSASASASASSSSHAAQQQQLAAERTRDLSKLMNQIVESANKASFVAQRAEFSQRQQWKMEEARVGAGIERGERLRMSGQDWQAPEKVLLKDMTRLTNALYQQSASASSQAFQTQRYTLTEGKARSMALQGIIGKIERVSGRRMENQDALPPAVPTSSSSKVRTTSISLPMSRSARTDTNSGLEGDDGADRAKGLQEILNEVVESGGGPTRKLAIASQRAQFVSK
ncbi:hypothetical protein BGZ98_004890 [Dissophora globulifera]|nr:hypothetical protein BGZ98_004890 [Dissophora globulifera]